MLDRLTTRLRLGGPPRHDGVEAETLALNYSYVFHEPSWSETVQRAAQANLASQRTTDALKHRLSSKDRMLGMASLGKIEPEIVLTAHVGAPAALQTITSRRPEPPAIVAVDSATQTGASQQVFFRAPGRLNLPNVSSERLAVVAVVVRPGGAELDLIATGPFNWPEMKAEVIAALEDLIRDYVDQWRPRRAVWPAPAEELLPEVVSRLDSGPGDAR
ncbi:MAG: hypothetical protein R3A46_11520 [Thermomicrobiales bacterium]